MILVFGKSGQVASELQRHASVVALGRADVDLSKPKRCISAIYERKPTAVINAAAYTDVDAAENNEALAMAINVDSPKAMAATCQGLGIPLVHISTDYVFSGVGDTPWQPNDSTDPQNAYGRSKLAAEIAVRNSGAVHAILRTSWAFSSYGNNFVKTMLRLSRMQDVVRVVADQFGGPTPASDIASACLRIADQLIENPSKSGTYHFSGAPDVSWADFATEIFSHLDHNVTVEPVRTFDYPTPAKRPLNSRLKCHSTEHVFGIKRPNWQSSLKEILKDLEGRS